MTRTAPAADATTALAAGAAADAGTLKALEFAAIREQLAELTAFGPSRALAEASLPVANAAHVALLQDQTDEAARLLAEQAQASIGGARDIRDALAQHGMKVSAATFHRLMRAEADRRGSASDTPATNAEVKA